MSALIYSALALSGSTLLTILSLVGLASWSRQIVKVVPTAPALLTLNNDVIRASRQPQVRQRCEVVKEVEGEQSPGQGDGAALNVAQWVVRSVPSLSGTFKPSWWLPNAHLQTIFSVIGNFTQVDQVTYSRTYLRVPDGGTLGLDFTPHDKDMPDDAPLIVVCHGLTGGSYESYVRNVLAKVIKPEHEGGLGGRAVVVNFRGCAGVPLTSPQLYSAGTTHDLSIALHYLRSIYPHAPLHGIGFSLGASVLSRYLGETGSSSLLSSGLALGCPWNLPGMSIKLEQHWFTRMVYSRAMAGNLVKLFFRHYDPRAAVFEDTNVQTAAPAPRGEAASWAKEEQERVDRQRSFIDKSIPALKKMRKRGGLVLRDVDEVLTAKLGGPASVGEFPFKGAAQYYEWASPYKLLHNVQQPLLAINAFDDPIIDGSYLPIPEVQASSHVYLAVTGAGGHLGWFDGPFWGGRSKSRWISKPAIEWLGAASRELGPVGRVVIEQDTNDQSGQGEKQAGTAWTWVRDAGHAIQGGGRRGWKVLDAHEVVHGEEGSGVLQGL